MWILTGTKTIAADIDNEERIIVENQKNQITRYLLGQLDEADEEQVEVRLLSDPEFSAEFDIVVDEISIRYISGGFEGDDKERVERYFLRAPERQNKVKVLCELLQHAKAVRADAEIAEVETPALATDEPGFFARVWRFWNAEPLMLRFGVTVAALVIVAGVVFLMRTGRPASQSFATLTLSSNDAERGQQPVTNVVPSVKLASGINELRLSLLLPAQPAQQPKSYRAEVIPLWASKRVTVVSQDSHSVVVAIPASDLKPDRYAIRLYAVFADGREEWIPGTYDFRVE